LLASLHGPAVRLLTRKIRKCGELLRNALYGNQASRHNTPRKLLTAPARRFWVVVPLERAAPLWLVKEDPLTARSADVRALHLLAIVSVVAAPLAVNAHAQKTSPSANASRYHIAVVDVSYIFKNYQRFKSGMQGMKSEMEGVESQLKQERNSIASKEQQREQYNAGSPEFRELDEEVARLKAEFNLKAGKVRRDFLEREAKVYYQTYMEVSNAVKYYAEQNNIGLVLRFNGDQIDPNQREDILRAINMPVVFQNQIDITPDVLGLLNRGEAPGAAASANRGGTTSR